MAYVDRSSNTRRTTTAIAVAAIQAGVIYAVATGLAVTFTARPPNGPIEAQQFRTEPIEDDTVKPKPPVDPKVEHDPRPQPSSRPADAEPAGPTAAEGGAGPSAASGSAGSAADDVVVIEPPKPPPLTFTPRGARPRNAPAGWATANDYPARDLREGNQGVTGFRLAIGADGKVLNCEVTRSSGFPSLDRTACDKITRRARFDPAMNGYGNKVAGSYTNNIRWEIPD